MFSLLDYCSILSSFACGSYIFPNTILLLYSQKQFCSSFYFFVGQLFVTKILTNQICSEASCIDLKWEKNKEIKKYISLTPECADIWGKGLHLRQIVLPFNTAFTNEDADVNKKQTNYYHSFCCCTADIGLQCCYSVQPILWGLWRKGEFL